MRKLLVLNCESNQQFVPHHTHTHTHKWTQNRFAQHFRKVQKCVLQNYYGIFQSVTLQNIQTENILFNSSFFFYLLLSTVTLQPIQTLAVKLQYTDQMPGENHFFLDECVDCLKEIRKEYETLENEMGNFNFTNSTHLKSIQSNLITMLNTGMYQNIKFRFHIDDWNDNDSNNDDEPYNWEEDLQQSDNENENENENECDGDNQNENECEESDAQNILQDEMSEFENSLDSQKYCLCNQEYDRKKMIQCNKCDEWYHPSCVSMSLNELNETKYPGLVKRILLTNSKIIHESKFFS